MVRVEKFKLIHCLKEFESETQIAEGWGNQLLPAVTCLPIYEVRSYDEGCFWPKSKTEDKWWNTFTRNISIVRRKCYPVRTGFCELLLFMWTTRKPEIDEEQE